MNGVGFSLSKPGSDHTTDHHKADSNNRANYMCELVFLMKYALALKRHG